MTLGQRPVNLIQLCLREDILQFADRRKSTFEFAFDFLVLCSPRKTFIRRDPKVFYFIDPLKLFSAYIQKDRILDTGYLPFMAYNHEFRFFGI